jgi:uncharacterized protein YbcC (UPF0753/DUF2309 family)
MPGAYYLDQLAAGVLKEADLEDAIQHLCSTLPASRQSILENWSATDILRELNTVSNEGIILTVAEAVDSQHRSRWSESVVESIAQFCAAYYDEGQAVWASPWKGLSLYEAWRQHAQLDASLEIQGLTHFRKWVRNLPPDAATAIAHLLPSFRIEDALEDFLHKQLLTIRGWAGYVQYRVRSLSMHGKADASLLDLLAVRLALDAALLAQYDGTEFREFWLGVAEASSEQSLALLVCQTAQERSWGRRVKAHLAWASASAQQRADQRPSVQAVFCIDVRSEVFRRHFESEDPSIETLGFAGFFGIPMEIVPFSQDKAVAQCPVLLSPKYQVRETTKHKNPHLKQKTAQRKQLGKRLQYALDSFKKSAVSCFSFVETAGLFFSANLLKNSLPKGSCPSPKESPFRPDLDPDSDTGYQGIGMEDRIALGKSILSNMGLTERFARLVVLCGHGSATTNNPYAAGLDCGACGGHAGDSNARIGTAILNDPAVRAALAAEGIPIPRDTVFVAGLHNTTTDEVALFDLELLPQTHREDLQRIESWLKAAGEKARKERSLRLGLASDHPNLDEQIFKRSQDWSQVRPEWGLAGNAAFIAAPRERTRGISLDGRSFLHSYDYRKDTDNSVLELIMCAPMVVANWINLQYYASTVNNAVFGSGNKTIHNVVGQIGICLGNSGDLQTGLPLQSLHDGRQWVHEPLRLHVYLEAPRERIDAVLEKHAGVRELVENGWLHLFAIEGAGKAIYERKSAQEWSAA